MPPFNFNPNPSWPPAMLAKFAPWLLPGAGRVGGGPSAAGGASEPSYNPVVADTVNIPLDTDQRARIVVKGYYSNMRRQTEGEVFSYGPGARDYYNLEQVQGNPVQSPDGNPDGEPLSYAIVTPLGKFGTSTLQIAADSMLTFPGVKALSDTLTLNFYYTQLGLRMFYTLPGDTERGPFLPGDTLAFPFNITPITLRIEAYPSAPDIRQRTALPVANVVWSDLASSFFDLTPLTTDTARLDLVLGGGSGLTFTVNLTVGGQAVGGTFGPMSITGEAADELREEYALEPIS